MLGELGLHGGPLHLLLDEELALALLVSLLLRLLRGNGHGLLLLLGGLVWWQVRSILGWGSRRDRAMRRCVQDPCLWCSNGCLRRTARARGQLGEAGDAALDDLFDLSSTDAR